MVTIPNLRQKPRVALIRPGPSVPALDMPDLELHLLAVQVPAEAAVSARGAGGTVVAFEVALEVEVAHPVGHVEDCLAVGAPGFAA